jgi:hypothetical protein
MAGRAGFLMALRREVRRRDADTGYSADGLLNAEADLRSNATDPKSDVVVKARADSAFVDAKGQRRAVAHERLPLPGLLGLRGCWVARVVQDAPEMPDAKDAGAEDAR